jgi:hypothetical protein
MLDIVSLTIEADYPFFLPFCKCAYFPSKNNIKAMMDYD